MFLRWQIDLFSALCGSSQRIEFFLCGKVLAVIHLYILAVEHEVFLTRHKIVAGVFRHLSKRTVTRHLKDVVIVRDIKRGACPVYLLEFKPAGNVRVFQVLV